MENVTKALLISGALMLVLLLICIGTYIVKLINPTVTSSASQMSQQEIMIHNARYELLKGIQTGKMVKQILEYAIEDNESLGEDARKKTTEDLCVNIRSNSEDILRLFKKNKNMYDALTTRDHGVRFTENIRLLSNIIIDAKKYDVWYSYTSGGYIWEVHIDDP